MHDKKHNARETKKLIQFVQNLLRMSNIDGPSIVSVVFKSSEKEDDVSALV
jgi:hypothetical protein